ncbi:MAG: hypothetical protein AB8H80_03780 [Planctomycetota bacterium]
MTARSIQGKHRSEPKGKPGELTAEALLVFAMVFARLRLQVGKIQAGQIPADIKLSDAPANTAGSKHQQKQAKRNDARDGHLHGVAHI